MALLDNACLASAERLLLKSKAKSKSQIQLSSTECVERSNQNSLHLALP